MKLEEMKKIAEKRTAFLRLLENEDINEDSFLGRGMDEADCIFLGMAANNWDKLMAVVDYAGYISRKMPGKFPKLDFLLKDLES